MANPATYYWTDWVLFTVQTGTLVVLIVYVVKTWQMASATRSAASASLQTLLVAEQARIEALAPRILIYFGSESSVAEVVIANVGAGTAMNVSFTFDPPLSTSQKGRDPMKFFERAKTALPPGYRIRHFFDVWHSYLGADPALPHAYRVHIEYSGAENHKHYTSDHVLDTSAIESLVTVNLKTLDDVVSQLAKINDVIQGSAKRLLDVALVGRDAGVYEGLRSDLEPALNALESLWRLHLAASAEPRALTNYDALRVQLLKTALGALHAAYGARVPAEAIGQLQNLCLLFMRAGVMGGFDDAEWESEVERALLATMRR